jgi:hypothetical protein
MLFVSTLIYALFSIVLYIIDKFIVIKYKQHRTVIENPY